MTRGQAEAVPWGVFLRGREPRHSLWLQKRARPSLQAYRVRVPAAGNWELPFTEEMEAPRCAQSHAALMKQVHASSSDPRTKCFPQECPILPVV